MAQLFEGRVDGDGPGSDGFQEGLQPVVNSGTSRFGEPIILWPARRLGRRYNSYVIWDIPVRVRVIWVVAMVAFVALAVRAAAGDVLGIDLRIARAIQDLPPALGAVFDFANWLGGSWPASLVTVGAAGVLAARRQKTAALLVLATFVPRAVQQGIKYIVEEPRPTADLVRVDAVIGNPSFPSGHVVGATVLFGLIFILAPRFFDGTRLVAAVRALCVLMVLAIGPARVWAGAHWPTDTIGGYLFAALFLLPAGVVLLASDAGGLGYAKLRLFGRADSG